MNAPTTTPASAKVAETTDDLGQQIETLRADLARISATAATNVADGVSTAGRRIGQSGRAARASVTDAMLEHPLTAVGLAAGLGFALAMVTRR